MLKKPENTKAALLELMEKYPHLNACGIAPPSFYRRDFQSERDELLSEETISLIDKAMDWLLINIEPIKIARYSSYSGKHVVERDLGIYYPNGAFIAAAMLLGYSFSIRNVKYPNEQNVNFGMSQKSVTRAHARSVIAQGIRDQIRWAEREAHKNQGVEQGAL